VYADMKFLQGVFKGNPDFTAVLRSPIIKADKKEKIVAAITTGRIRKKAEKKVCRKLQAHLLISTTGLMAYAK
jgi:F0F1-type ATP synthase delta subunit